MYWIHLVAKNITKVVKFASLLQNHGLYSPNGQVHASKHGFEQIIVIAHNFFKENL